MKIINNGSSERKVPDTQSIPIGWKRGRVKLTPNLITQNAMAEARNITKERFEAQKR